MEAIHLLAEYVALVVNLLAIFAIAIGSLMGAIGLSRLLLTNADEDALRPVWLAFGRWLGGGADLPARRRHRRDNAGAELG